MPNYQNGKIYKLVSDHTDKIYIGSTTQPLSKRLGGHMSAFKRYTNGSIKNECKSFELFQNGEVKIILLEKYPCDDIEELTHRERFYIETIPNCVNKLLTMTREKTLLKYNHSDKRYKTLSQYRHTEKGKEALKRQVNSVARKEYLKLKHNCECGRTVLKSALASHKRSSFHQKNAVLL